MDVMDSRQWTAKSYPYSEADRCWTVKRGEGWTIMVTQFMFTSGLLIQRGPVSLANWYTDRWCYTGPGSAFAAAEAWDPDTQDEPRGWHRHPASGRRRALGGDPATEYVAE